MVTNKSALKPIDKPNFSFWQALYNAFYNPQLYVDVVVRWRGWGFKYLFFLVSIIALPLTFWFILDFNTYFENQLVFPIKSLPTFYIQNGQVFFDQNMPYLIKNAQNKVVAIIDTTGTVTEFTKAYPDLVVLITKDSYNFKPPEFKFFNIANTQFSSQKYTKIFEPQLNTVANGKVWLQESNIQIIKYFTFIVAYPVFIAILFPILLGLCIMLALLGRFWAKVIFKYYLTYAQSTRLMTVSFTAPAFILIVISVILPFSTWGLWFQLLIAIYFNFGVAAARSYSKILVHK